MYDLQDYELAPPFDKHQEASNLTSAHLFKEEKLYLALKCVEIVGSQSRRRSGGKMTYETFCKGSERRTLVSLSHISKRLFVTDGLESHFMRLKST
jgi:hypothetical protein